MDERRVHRPEDAGSTPAPATIEGGLAVSRDTRHYDRRMGGPADCHVVPPESPTVGPVCSCAWVHYPDGRAPKYVSTTGSPCPVPGHPDPVRPLSPPSEVSHVEGA